MIFFSYYNSILAVDSNTILWEYAAKQDGHSAMFFIIVYAKFLELYFPGVLFVSPWLRRLAASTRCLPCATRLVVTGDVGLLCHTKHKLIYFATVFYSCSAF